MRPLQVAFRTCTQVYSRTRSSEISAGSVPRADTNGADPLDPDGIVPAVRNGSPERFERAVGRLTAAPIVPRPTASRVSQLLVDRCTDPSPIVQRAAYRGLHAVHAHHPDLITHHVRTLTRGLTAFQIHTREQCGALFAAICTRSPQFAPLLYPLLRSIDRHVRDTALSALVVAADSHPIVLAPVWPFLDDQLSSPTVDRIQLLQAVDRLVTSELISIELPTDVVLGWFGSVEVRTERAVIEVLRPRLLDGGQQARVATRLLTLLPTSDRRRSAEYVSQLEILVEENPTVVSAIDDWSETASPIDQRRVQARLDAHAADASLTRVISSNHPAKTSSSSVPGSP